MTNMIMHSANSACGVDKNEWRIDEKEQTNIKESVAYKEDKQVVKYIVELAGGFLPTVRNMTTPSAGYFSI